MAKPKPTGQGIRSLHAKLIRDWDECFNKDLDMRDLVYQRNAIELLPESPDHNMVMLEVHSGRAGAVVEHANGLLMAMPDYHATPLSLSTEDTREAEQVERVHAALFEKYMVANDFWTHIGRDILIYDRAFIKSLPMEAAWTQQEGMPVREKGEKGKDYLKRVRQWKDTEGDFPHIVEYVPALNILAHLDSNNNILASIEEKLVDAETLADELGAKDVREELDRGGLKWYDELTVIEYMDDEWVAYFLVDTTPADKNDEREPYQRVKAYKRLRAWKHGLGVHPIVMIPGVLTEMEPYADKFKGFLTDAKDAFETYDFLLSRLASMVYAYYLPSYEWKLPATTRTMKGRKRPVMRVNLAGVTVTYGDEELHALQIPQGLPDATMLMTQVDDLIQRHTLEDVLFGRVSGSAPAFQVNLRINVAKSKLTPISQHMAQGLTKLTERFNRSVEQVGEAVMIDGEKITVAMARKYRHKVAAQIEPKSPTDRSHDLGAAQMALDMGLPKDWVWENMLDIENPATLMLQSDIRELEQLPQVKERLMMEALEQLDLLVEEEEFEELTPELAEGLPPEVMQAIEEVMGGGAGAPGSAQPNLLLPSGPGDVGSILGRGPFPEGGSPQAVQGGRGLLTPNQQPEPGAVQPASMGGFQ